jgi:hypothetical protein
VFLRRTLPARRAIGDTLSDYGLTADLRHRLWQAGRNSHLNAPTWPPLDSWAPRHAVEILIPIEATIRGTVVPRIDRDQVVLLPDRPATYAEMRDQLEILKFARNQLGHDTGTLLNYIVPRSSRDVVSLLAL